MGPFKDIGVDLAKDMVATIEIQRAPHNYFDIDLIRQIADACEGLDRDDSCRAIVLASQGTAFCAGAKLGDGADVQNVLVKKSEAGQAGHLYIEAVRLYNTVDKGVAYQVSAYYLENASIPDDAGWVHFSDEGNITA